MKTFLLCLIRQTDGGQILSGTRAGVSDSKARCSSPLPCTILAAIPR